MGYKCYPRDQWLSWSWRTNKTYIGAVEVLIILQSFVQGSDLKSKVTLLPKFSSFTALRGILLTQEVDIDEWSDVKQTSNVKHAIFWWVILCFTLIRILSTDDKNVGVLIKFNLVCFEYWSFHSAGSIGNQQIYFCWSQNVVIMLYEIYCFSYKAALKLYSG
jgi:hypothetical protein